nr:N-acetylmuramoyl-L-alanine amidase [uncultured Cohaesibacter sp.]
MMTRETDKFISLGNRVAFSRKHKADLFVSIHADIVQEHYVRGATVYTLSDKASDAVAHKLAQQENKSDLLAGLPVEEKDDVVADILIDLTRRETTNHSNLYSRTLVGALKSSIRLSKTPQRSAGFKVSQGTRYSERPSGAWLSVQQDRSGRSSVQAMAAKGHRVHRSFDQEFLCAYRRSLKWPFHYASPVSGESSAHCFGVFRAVGSIIEALLLPHCYVTEQLRTRAERDVLMPTAGLFQGWLADWLHLIAVSCVVI